MASDAGRRPAIRRRAQAVVEEALVATDCVGLFGPRQVGKTTIARTIAAASGSGAIYLDLRNGDDRSRLTTSEEFLSAHSGKLIVLDEVHCMVEALDFVRRQLELQVHSNVPTTRFLLLGSSTSDMKGVVSERLGSRLRAIELCALDPTELPGPEPASAAPNLMSLANPALTGPIRSRERPISLDRLWSRGGFPLSLIAPSDELSYGWRRDYLRSCFERDTARAAHPVLPRAVRKLLERIAGTLNGEIVSLSTAENWCLDVLVLQGLVRELRPWSRNLLKRQAKSRKLYIRDSGLLHALHRCRSLEDVGRTEGLLGHSWEGFCIEALANNAGSDVDAYFYRDDEQNEVDLVLDFGGKLWAVEIKLGRQTKAKGGFYRACEKLKPDRRFVINRGERSILSDRDVPTLTLDDALTEIGRMT